MRDLFWLMRKRTYTVGIYGPWHLVTVIALMALAMWFYGWGATGLVFLAACEFRREDS